jgi:hypothetical protein
MEKHLTENVLQSFFSRNRWMLGIGHAYKRQEGVLPYIRRDFKQWTWEGDESDDNISAKTETIHQGKLMDNIS